MLFATPALIIMSCCSADLLKQVAVWRKGCFALLGFYGIAVCMQLATCLPEIAFYLAHRDLYRVTDTAT